ncbi:MAG: hypothetical protein L6R45_18740 [Anaerolineae bacterium]|nr:hypothetical protein [Anaerolineae bacterium]
MDLLQPLTLFNQVSLKTRDALRTIAISRHLRDLSSLTLPEIEAAVDLVSQVVPAGNVPGVILNGLARISGRKPPAKVVQRDINLLFQGVEQALNTAVYGAFFAGPAAVIWGYQNLLRLAGKDPEDSFPEGTWQFYVDYALREDTARHATETHGFDTRLKQHRLSLSPVVRLTAWAMAAIHCLHQYPQLLENEWRERVYTQFLQQLTADQPDAAHYARLYRAWEKQRPYERGADAQPDETYPQYRRRKFDSFLAHSVQNLPTSLRHELARQIRQAEAEVLPAYQQQMSILAYLDPGPYGETRTPVPLRQLCLGLIYQGGYHLIPASAPGGTKPADVALVRAQVAAILARPSTSPPAPLTPLARLTRSAWPELRQKLSPALIKEFDTLRRAPILLNADPRPVDLPLAELRQAERGIGDHALTLFDTGETFVFDQSHIFFDGTWGAALAEIMTNEALSWAVYLNTLPPIQAGSSRLKGLTFHFKAEDLALLEQTPTVAGEVSAETKAVNLKAILRLRQALKQRNALLELTVSDLLILYRAVHAVTYQPAQKLLAQLQKLSKNSATQEAAMAALDALQPARPLSPAIVIPVDASRRNPRDRLHPMTFEVPLNDLDLLNLHRRTVAARQAYQQGQADFAKFSQLRGRYLRFLAEFGRMLCEAKKIALTGESASVGSIKLLAHLPTPLQRMLDQVPSRFDILNDLIRGREVFSNVGAVVPGSTLTRFITAKDDNDKKTLAWGIMTDADGVMHISLRDFRPHVAALIATGHKELATSLTRHYLDAYANGLNRFIADLRDITEAGEK